MTTAQTNAPPRTRGRFGPYGGQYVPETIMPALEELDDGFRAALADPAFQTQLAQLLRTFVGRAQCEIVLQQIVQEVGA